MSMDTFAYYRTISKTEWMIDVLEDELREAMGRMELAPSTLSLISRDVHAEASPTACVLFARKQVHRGAR